MKTTPWLTEAQRALVRSSPPFPGDPNKLRRAIKESGRSQSDIAEALGKKRQVISRYIGGRDLYLGLAFDIAALFGLTPCDLWPMRPRVTDARKPRRALKSNGRKAPKAMAA